MLEHQDEFQINNAVPTLGAWTDIEKIENYQMRLKRNYN